MSSSVQVALTALFIGMIVVFIALSIVVASGRLLIRLVNTYSPDTSDRHAAAHSQDTAPAQGAVVAVLSAAVASATQGKGRISHIESIDLPNQTSKK